MPIERVQQWIGASLAFVILELLAGGMVMFAAWSAREGSRVPLLVISGIWGLAAIGGARLILQKKLQSAWLLVALVWPLVGAYLIFGS
jgi:peptidoglycan/LPS O-acetylase OafA/YrhL